jgi:uncharacterized protein YkwD
MRTAAVALLALCMGCASIVPIEDIAPVVASDALERLPQAGRQQIATGRIDFPLLAAAVFVESNRERRKHGLPSLAYLPALETISTLHASDMVLHRFFNHVNPVDAYRRTVADRLDLVDLPASFYAENIARTFPLQIDIRTGQSGALHSTVYPLDTPGQFSLTPNGPPILPHTYASFARDLVEDWMNSPSHRSNLLDTQAKYLGCGCALEVDEVGFPTLVCGQVFYAY